MRMWILVCVLLSSVTTWACSPACRTGEVKVGDRCVAVLDAASEEIEEDGSIKPGSQGDGWEPGGGDSGDVQRSDGDGQVGAFDAAGEAGIDLRDALSGDAESAPDNAGDASGADGCSGSSCVVDACHPNPCGHGSCNLVPGGTFSCLCEPDWRGNSTCTANINAALSGLTVSAGKLYPTFKSSVYQYSVDLPLGATEMTLTPVAAQPEGVVLRLDGEVRASGQPTPVVTVTLNQPSRLQFSVTSDSGDVKTYAVTLRRTLKLQATFGDGSPDNSDYFGSALATNGDLLAVTNTSGASTYVDFYTRSPDGRWSYVLQAPGTSKANRVALGDRWLAVSTADGTAYALDRTLGPGHALPIPLPSSPAAEGFGKSIAVEGNLVTVLSSSALHTYELSDTSSIRQTTVPVGEAQFMAMRDNLLVTSKPGTSTPDVDPEAANVRVRAGADWGPAKRPDSGPPHLLGGAVGVGDGRIYAADFYGCFTTCTGQTPTFNVFDRSGDQWERSRVTIPAAPNVPRESHPVMFGTAMAVGPDFVVVSAPWVLGLQPGVVRSGDPQAPAPTEVAGVPYFGLAYVFVKRAGAWVLEATLGPARAESPERQPGGFGSAMDYSDGRIVISAPIRGGGPSPGAGGEVYVFGPDCSVVPEGADVLGC